MIATDAKARCVSWLLNFWRHRRDAERLAIEYQEMRTDKPLVLADLARYCNYFDTSIECGANGDVLPIATVANEARRDVFLHILEMMKLDPVDLQNLKEVTEQ